MNLKKNSIELKVSFRTNFDDEGTSYKKCISIPKKAFDAFMLSLQSEQAIERETIRKMYLHSSIGRKNNLRFLNLTQTDYFIKWAKRQYEIKVSLKRLDAGLRNTCLLIK